MSTIQHTTDFISTLNQLKINHENNVIDVQGVVGDGAPKERRRKDMNETFCHVLEELVLTDGSIKTKVRYEYFLIRITYLGEDVKKKAFEVTESLLKIKKSILKRDGTGKDVW